MCLVNLPLIARRVFWGHNNQFMIGLTGMVPLELLRTFIMAFDLNY
jgi:hypothetical protein